MNSSGIKRGLAASAVAALAVTGIPALASSASAAPGDELQFVAAGPTRDSIAGTAPGGYVVLKAKGVADLADAQARITAIGTDLVSSEDNANQSVEVNSGGIVFMADAASNPFGGADGYSEIYVPVRVDTATVGATASYALFLDDGTAGVQSTEARVQVQQATSGAPASITVEPSVQTAPAGVQSGNYVGTVKDAAGRVTQILGGGAEDITINPDADTSIQKVSTPASAEGANDGNIVVGVADVAQRGTFTFKARSSATTLHTIAIDGPGTADASAQLDVVEAAAGITQQEVDVVTGADTREGFGNATGNVTIRPDQANVRIDIADADNKNKTVSVTATGTGVTFGGAATKTYTVTLDAQGKGSITVAVDPASIASGDSFTVVGSGINITATYAAPAVTAANVTADAATYLSSFGGTVNPTVTVTDQYGTPVSGVYVTVDRRNGANAADAESARVVTNAQGKASFTLTDTSAGTGPKATDDLFVTVYPGQIGNDPLVAAFDAADIVYSQTGTGADFTLTVDGQLPAGSAYNPANVFVNPLTDTTADDAGDSTDETITLGITGGTAGAPFTVTVDGGALLLKGTETRLSQASATDSGVLPATGANAFQIVGTKSGLVNVTVTSGGKTQTAQVSVKALSQSTAPADLLAAPGTARNVTLEGPESANAGDVVNFTATVTDAFGNPVAGVFAGAFNTLVSGGGQVVGGSNQSDANGKITFQVQIADSANDEVSLQITGNGADFGAAANRLTASSTTDDGAGLTASENVASATIADVDNIEELEQAVADAQDKVDNRQDALDVANGNLQVAQAEKQVAQADVKAAKKDLKKAKKQKKGVRAAKAALREAKGDLKVANAKVKAAKASVATAQQRLADAQAELEAAQQELEDAQND